MKRISNLPVLVVLTVLTLFSSCTVRKSIQAQLDIPVTKQLNPSKATVTGQQHCGYSDPAIAVDQTKKGGFELPNVFLPPFPNLYLPTPETVRYQTLRVSIGWCISDKVPIYILYKKMKLWV